MSGLSGCECDGTGKFVECWENGHQVLTNCWCVAHAARIAELEAALLPFAECHETLKADGIWTMNIGPKHGLRAAEVLEKKQ